MFPISLSDQCMDEVSDLSLCLRLKYSANTQFSSRAKAKGDTTELIWSLVALDEPNYIGFAFIFSSVYN